jgi:predicted dehydrogenase
LTFHYWNGEHNATVSEKAMHLEEAETSNSLTPARLALPASALIIGAGYAGTRFAKSISHLERQRGEVYLGGVIDANATRLPPWMVQGIPTFSNLCNALEQVDPDLVVVAVNEDQHFAVLQTVAQSRPRCVLCEKPLTSTLAEAEALLPLLCHSRLSLNLVERFSDIVLAAKQWLTTNKPIDVLRVEFQWGKHRIADPRPTIGVSSEVIHPIDLVHFLFAPGMLQDITGFTVSSALRHRGALYVDSLHFAAYAEAGFTLIGHASFTWPRRVRNITALVRDGRKRLYRLILTFDTPHWDCDEFIVEELDQHSGRYRCVERLAISVDSLPEEARGVNKIIRLINASISHWATGARQPLLADARHAVQLQRTVEDIFTKIAHGVTRERSLF